MAKKIKIPKRLQAILWSADIKQLNLKKDRGYIIHQIFSYGTWNDVMWIFKTFPLKEIKHVFTTIPFKDYAVARFYFVKNYLLRLQKYKLNELRYVKNIPRDLGR